MIVVAFIDQKGDVGKSTLTRVLAREAASSGLEVKVGDLDTDQATISCQLTASHLASWEEGLA